MKYLSFVAIMVCVASGRASASFFERTEMRLEGRVIRILPEDLDQDGRLDILAVYTAGHHPETRRWLAVFRQDTDGHFPANPEQVWSVDARASILDVGDVDPLSGQEILYMARDGVYAYGQEAGVFQQESRRLFEAETMLFVPADDDLPTWDLAREVCPDGGDEILVPGFDEIGLWRRNGSALYERSGHFAVTMRSTVQTESPGENDGFSLRADYSFPRVESEDFDGDGRTDLLISWEDNLDVFLQDPQNSFPAHPDHEVRMGIGSRGEPGEKEEVSLSSQDLNADGQIDIIVNRIKGGLDNAQTRTSLYLRRPGKEFGTTPDQTITAKDAFSEPLLIDLDGDGRPDLIQPEVKMGIKSVVSMLLMKQVDIHFLVYLNHGDGLFPAEPDFGTKVSFQLDFTRQGGQFSMFMDCQGDYNGDGRKDLAVGTKRDELAIFFGDAHKVFTRNPQVQEAVRTSSRTLARDFNVDGKTDLLLYYPDEEDMNNRIVLLWSR